MKGVWETKAKCLRQDMALPPRNFTQRKSTVIKKKAASNLHHAFWVSIAAGPPLTHVVTINVTNTGLPYTKSSAAFTKLRSRKCAPWLRAEQQIRNMHPTPPTYTWSIEAPQRENSTKPQACDIHIHWALYIPPGLIRQFAKNLKLWIAQLFKGISNHRHVVRRKVLTSSIGTKRYMSKGMSRSVAKRANILSSPQGTITGRRSGFSENLGPTVRRNDPAVRPAVAAAKAAQGPAHAANEPDPVGLGQVAGRAAYRAAGGQRRY